MPRKVTIQDIADELGISRNTVSKAINNSEGLSEATRARILQKAVEMGYKQFSYVQALYQVTANIPEETQTLNRHEAQAPQSRELALLTTACFTGSHFASLMLDRLQQELNRLGYRLNTYHVSPGEIRSRRLPFSLQPERIGGIVCMEIFDWEYACTLCELSLPTLFIDAPASPDGRALPADLLLMDNTNGLCRLMHELLGQGVRRIGFLGDYMHCQSFYERYLAYRISMMKADVPVEDRFVIPANGAAELFARLSALEELPELFVCANDFVAYDALQILRNLGKAVPDDVMLCGFDDAPESRMVIPALTTVHIHTQAMAFSAAQMLITRIQEPSLDYRRIYTQTDLMLRESTKLPGEQEPD